MISSGYFVSTVFERCKKDKAYRSLLRKADNPDTEWYSWEIICPLIGDAFDDTYMRSCYILVASSIALSHASSNGMVSLGKAFYIAEKNQDSKLPVRFHRLLSCSDKNEVVGMLHQYMRLFDSRRCYLDFVKLLDDLLRYRFPDAQDGIKARWVADYFRSSEKEDEEA